MGDTDSTTTRPSTSTVDDHAVDPGPELELGASASGGVELQRTGSVQVPAPAAPVLPAGALARLPAAAAAAGGDSDPYWRLVTAFLVGYPPHSSRAYFSDLKGWYGWCAHAGVHPLAARRHHVDVWVRYLSEEPQPRTGRPASPASIARRLSCLSRFYDYAIKDAELVDYSPVANVRRPKVSDDSSTVGLTAEQLDALLTAAEQHGPRSAALISLLVYNGLRISEVLACDVEHFTHQRGHRVLRIVRKGGKASTEPLAPIVLRTLEIYIADRSTGPIFLNTEATDRLSYSIAYKLIRRLAKRAGIPAADKITPHSLRHSFATELLSAGVPLQDVQDAMGHADPRTTRAYDRARHSLDRHPTYTMATQLHRTAPHQPLRDADEDGSEAA
jgi:site-specific recombinase XerD